MANSGSGALIADANLGFMDYNSLQIQRRIKLIIEEKF
tara:strand:+ start:88 stop:201 length:114 start_codon:yes stop_codon:yes gene_type:complete